MIVIILIQMGITNLVKKKYVKERDRAIKITRILYHSILILLAFVLLLPVVVTLVLLSFGKLADPVSPVVFPILHTGS